MSDKRLDFGATIDRHRFTGGCMKCNSLTVPVIVFYLGQFQARLCDLCARSLCVSLGRAAGEKGGAE